MCLVVAALLAISAVAHAEETNGDWNFNLAPLYLWAVRIDGSQTLGTVPVELEFSDIFDNVETLFTFHFEGLWKNKWGFLLDYNNFSLGGRSRYQTVRICAPTADTTWARSPVHTGSDSMTTISISFTGHA